MTRYAEVLLSLPLNEKFLYVVPELFREKTKKGSRVLVPFKQRMLTGYVVRLRKKCPSLDFKLKEITEVLDEKPVFSPSFLVFTQKLSQYYHSSWGEILQASLPPSFTLKSRTKVFLTEKGRAVGKKDDLSAVEWLILTTPPTRL